MNNPNNPIRFLTILSLFSPNKRIKNNNYENEISDQTLNSIVNEFYTDIMNIIVSESYFNKGVLADINDIDENYGWYIVSTIHFKTELDDEITLWKYDINENKWYEKIISARLLLQLNGS
jgi:hypothetical protein